MAENKDAQFETAETVEIPFSGQMVDAQSFARSKAKELAAQKHRPVKVKLVNTAGKTVAQSSEQKPPARPTDVKEKAEGKEQKEPPKTDQRIVDQVTNKTRNFHGTDGEGDEQGGTSPTTGGVNKYQPNVFLGNLPREVSGQIASMEAVMMDIPNQSIGKFTSVLPAAFKSLLPLGSIPGLIQKGPVSLNGLLTLVGGAALGAATGQAIRSSLGGINAVSGLTGALGAVAISKVLGGSGAAVPKNIATSYGKSTNSSAVLANVVGTVATVALKKSVTGIPVTSQVLGLAANVALRSIGTPISVPTRVLGTASSTALKPISAVLGAAVGGGGRVPILPTNLSLPRTGILSGISQNIAPALAEKLIPRNSIVNLLPPNLQRQIPRVPQRITNPYSKNSVSINRDAAPEKSQSFPKSNREEKEAFTKKNTGTSTYVAYEQKISKYYTVADFSKNAHFDHKIVPQNGLSVDQIIENLSLLAVNCADPIKENFPGFTITSGFRGPGGTNIGGDHGHGRAVDMQWGNKTTNYHLDVARWIAANLKFYQLIIEHSPKTHNLWIHVAFRKGQNNSSNIKTMINGGYQSGLINYWPTRLS